MTLTVDVTLKVGTKGVPKIFHWGGSKTEGQKAESGDGVLGEGQQPPPHQLGICGSAVSSPAGFPPHQLGGLWERFELPSGVPPTS